MRSVKRYLSASPGKREYDSPPADPQMLMDVLRHQVHTPTDGSMNQMVFDLVDTLAQRVPLWELYCNKDPEAAKVAYLAMHGQQDQKLVGIIE